MDRLISAAARALATGDPLAALKQVALRDDAPALALRGIAMAQMGDFPRAKDLLRRAGRAFDPDDAVARARCVVAEAEIALVSRDLSGPQLRLHSARATLAMEGDWPNALHAGYLDARRLLLIGRLDESERCLGSVDVAALQPASQVGYWLVAAGVAMRRLRAAPARDALDQADQAAERTGIAALVAEVEWAKRTFDAPAARLVTCHGERLLAFAEVEALISADVLLVDACRMTVRTGEIVVSLAGRPVLFALARALGEAWPADVARETLIAGTFRGRQADESHRARLRVEIGRLRKALEPLAGVAATRRGFVLQPRSAPTAAVLAPPVEGNHADVLALLADGEAWSSSALALALGMSARSVQRALEVLAETGEVEPCGRGRARRWLAPKVPGFPTILLLPARATGE